MKNISRGSGRSVVAAAAYRAGETLPNEAEERLSAFGGRRDVLHNEIALPADAPDWMANRAQLWNAVEAAEIRKDARLAKEIEVALPRELSAPVWLGLARQLAAVYAAKGFVVDFAIHDDGTAHNPHVHMLLTTRLVTAEGFGGKIRSADGRQFVEEARALWGRLANEALANAGLDASIDPRSHARAGVEMTPTVHRGPDAQERRLRRENMGLSRKLPRSTAPTDQAQLDRLMEGWPASQMERRAEQERDLPVPDPAGNPISPRQLEAAQERMVEDMERQPFDIAQSRRWASPEVGPSQPEPDREKPVVSKRWTREAPEREPEEVKAGAVRSRRWQEPDREADDDRDAARYEPTREPVRD
ncbi:hypothetical protein ABID16_004667 [Rhizobium aquaticum]|uniref:MobA/MobL protein domain-containing protein n=1 Tax=Rhizobium aquaticum TaxID=1549636 RepID=A0ABV2J6B7_9HYPH